MSAPVLLLKDPSFLLHDPGPGHPESARRLAAVYQDLDGSPVPGTRAEEPPAIGLAALQRVHEAAYLERLAATEGEERVQFDPDTATSAHSYRAALHAAGAVARAVEAVVSGDARNAFALVRPPGHHALPARAMGFCLVNNVAVAAAHALAEAGLRRVLILDPDLHHGNGTEAVFWNRQEVLFVSAHQYPFWPGTGAVDELGGDAGAGYTVNLPLPAGSGDADYLHVFKHAVQPVVDEFEPELILVSAGFDAAERDPLGGMRLTPDGYRALFGMFRAWAERHCPGRLVCALEGGYDPDGLALDVRTALEALSGPEAAPAECGSAPQDAARRVAERSREALNPWWRSLRA